MKNLEINDYTFPYIVDLNKFGVFLQNNPIEFRIDFTSKLEGLLNTTDPFIIRLVKQGVDFNSHSFTESLEQAVDFINKNKIDYIKK